MGLRTCNGKPVCRLSRSLAPLQGSRPVALLVCTQTGLVLGCDPRVEPFLGIPVYCVSSLGISQGPIQMPERYLLNHGSEHSQMGKKLQNNFHVQVPRLSSEGSLIRPWRVGKQVFTSLLEFSYCQTESQAVLTGSVPVSRASSLWGVIQPAEHGRIA